MKVLFYRFVVQKFIPVIKFVQNYWRFRLDQIFAQVLDLWGFFLYPGDRGWLSYNLKRLGVSFEAIAESFLMQHMHFRFAADSAICTFAPDDSCKLSSGLTLEWLFSKFLLCFLLLIWRIDSRRRVCRPNKNVMRIRCLRLLVFPFFIQIIIVSWRLPQFLILLYWHISSILYFLCCQRRPRLPLRCLHLDGNLLRILLPHPVDPLSFLFHFQLLEEFISRPLNWSLQAMKLSDHILFLSLIAGPFNPQKWICFLSLLKVAVRISRPILSLANSAFYLLIAPREGWTMSLLA
jgi:hypothetical protein